MKRCAIYTRKSSSEGLQQGLNSLDAQRQFCESFVSSQAGEGWEALPARYDDGGFSGGSLDRPAVRRLMDDVAAGGIDVVVVYKIDRLSRSLIDFSSLIGRFETHGVSFVAVTQAFNTTSSMGRLTLNVLLSFAQFERELAGERLRDKAAASRAVGRWTAGSRPFGYRVEKGFLVVDGPEAEVIRRVYARYAEFGSTRSLAAELVAADVRNKTGGHFTKSSVRVLLKNRLYRGDLVHHGRPVPGVHEAIVTERSWVRAQEALAHVVLRHRPLTRPFVPNPLKGRIFGPDGGLISQDFVYNRQGNLYRYYMPSGRCHAPAATNPNTRFRAGEFDAAVAAAIDAFIPSRLRDKPEGHPPDILRRLVSRIDIGRDEMTIAVSGGATVTTAIVGRVRTERAPKPKASASPHTSRRSPAPQSSDDPS